MVPRTAKRQILRPQELLTLMLARGNLTADGKKNACAFMAEPLNWHLMIETITAEEVYPLVYRNLEMHGCPGVPGHIRDRLKGMCKINAFRNALLCHELASILKLFAAAGIPAIPLKGVVLAQALYGDAGLRVCSDTDILIPRSLIGRVLLLLRTNGYESELTSRALSRVVLRHDIEYPVAREEHGFHYLLELHWGVWWGGRLEQAIVGRLWADAYRSTVFGAPAYALSREWQILFLCAHAARHHWQGLKWLVDLHELFSSPGLDWSKLDEKAREVGWEEVVRISLCACNALFSTPIPANFSLGELPHWVRIFPECASASLTGTLYPTRFMERLSDKLRYVARVLLVPTSAEVELVSVPSFLSYLYYVLRPLRLGFKWASTLVRSAVALLTIPRFSPEGR